MFKLNDTTDYAIETDILWTELRSTR